MTREAERDSLSTSSLIISLPTLASLSHVRQFLVSKNGEVLGRYFSTTTPDKIAGDIEKALEQ